MATFTRKKLAFLKMSAVKSTLYDSGATIGLVHNMILFNDDAGSQTVQIYMHDGTHEYQLFELVITTKDTVILDFKAEGLVVDASSKLTGNIIVTEEASSSSSYSGVSDSSEGGAPTSGVTCLITGSEETA